MRARCGAALAAAALAASAGARAADGGTCELPRVERSTASSRACMACHDGSAGAAIGLRFQMAPGAGAMSHPIEVDYGAAAAAHPGQYQLPAALPPEVLLVRGRIECTTCHDGASPDRKRVAAVKDLCLACHRL